MKSWGRGALILISYAWLMKSWGRGALMLISYAGLVGCSVGGSSVATSAEPCPVLTVNPAILLPGASAELRFPSEINGAVRWRASAGQVRQGQGPARFFAPWHTGQFQISAELNLQGRQCRCQATVQVRRFRPAASPGCGGLRCEHLYTLMRPDQTPALNRPHVVAASEARQLRPQDRVLGVWTRQGARAYPLHLLAYHRVINDELGARRVVLAFSPLTEATLCLATSQMMAATGQVYESDELLAVQGDTLRWSVMLRRPLAEASTGPGIPLPCAVMTWDAFRQLKPEATVAWPEQSVQGFDYTQDPWEWYRRNADHLVAPRRYVDLRLSAKQPVVGVVHGAVARAFPLGERSQQVINTTVNGASLLVVLDGPRRFGAAYYRRCARRELSFEVQSLAPTIALRDKETGSTWNALGEALAGPLAGQRLEQAQGQTALFFAWAAFYQQTEIQHVLVDERRRNKHD